MKTPPCSTARRRSHAWKPTVRKKSPAFSPAAPGPKREQAECATGHVNQHVRKRSEAAGDEQLMHFVGGGIKHDAEQFGAGQPPRPRTRIVPVRLAKRTPEQQREHRVFSQMRALADAQHGLFKGFWGGLRKQPQDNWFDDS